MALFEAREVSFVGEWLQARKRRKLVVIWKSGRFGNEELEDHQPEEAA